MADHQRGGEQPVESNIFSMLLKRRRGLDAGQAVGPTVAGPNAGPVSQAIAGQGTPTPVADDDIGTAVQAQIDRLKRFLGLRGALNQQRPEGKKR